MSTNYSSGLAGSQAAMLAKQDNDFGDYGTKLTLDAYTKNTPDLRKLVTDTGYNFDTDPGTSSLWDETKSLVGNKDFMAGAMGLGQLGLGLANYLSMKPVYKEQLKGLKQNRQFAAADQATQDAARTGFKNISIKGVPDQAVLQANKAAVV